MSLASVAVIVVAVAFTGLVIWVVWPSNKERLEGYGSIPLDDSEEAPR